jgi:hypothetical protein
VATGGKFHPVVLARGNIDADMRFDGHRENEPVVVIRVFADEVDAARGNHGERGARSPGEAACLRRV